MASVDEETRIKRIAPSIRVIPNLSMVGLMFQDITTLLLDPKAFRDMEFFVESQKDMQIFIVAGVEARGFIFGSFIALAFGAKFLPLRKPKKLLRGILCAVIKQIECAGAEVIESACIIELAELKELCKVYRDEASGLFKNMLFEEFKPKVVSYNSLIQLFCKP